MGASRATLPSATSCSTVAATNVLVMLAARIWVCGTKPVRASTSEYPAACQVMFAPSRTAATPPARPSFETMLARVSSTAAMSA